jgi:hypothetical protein
MARYPVVVGACVNGGHGLPFESRSARRIRTLQQPPQTPAKTTNLTVLGGERRNSPKELGSGPHENHGLNPLIDALGEGGAAGHEVAGLPRAQKKTGVQPITPRNDPKAEFVAVSLPALALAEIPRAKTTSRAPSQTSLFCLHPMSLAEHYGFDDAFCAEDQERPRFRRSVAWHEGRHDARLLFDYAHHGLPIVPPRGLQVLVVIRPGQPGAVVHSSKRAWAKSSVRLAGGLAGLRHVGPCPGGPSNLDDHHHTTATAAHPMALHRSRLCWPSSVSGRGRLAAW